MEKGRARASLKQVFSETPPTVRWLIYLSSFSAVSYGYLFILIPGYLIEPDVGLTSADAGLLLGVIGITFAVLAIPIGILADRKGRKWLLIAGMIGTSPPLFVFAYTHDMAYLLIASVAMGATEVAFMASWNALIADLTSQERRSSAFALSFVIGTLTFGLGFALPGMFPLVERVTGWSSYSVHMGTLVVLGLLSLLSAVGMWLLLKDLKEDMRPSERIIRRDNLRVLLKFSGINGLIGLGAGFIIPLIPTWFYLKFDVPDTYSGPLLMLSSVAMGMAAFASSALARKHGIIRAIVMTQSISTAFMLSLAFADMALLAAALYLVRAALMNMAIPLLDSYLMGIVLKEERGVASAVNAIIWRLPNAGTAIVGGMLLHAGSYALPFYLATACYAVGITLFYAVFKNVKPIS
jgi:MFS family permease